MSKFYYGSLHLDLHRGLGKEYCYTKAFWRAYIKRHKLESIELKPAKIEVKSTYFICQELVACGEKAEGGCGKQCGEYAPRNGKSGRCRHSKNPYEPTGERVILFPNGKIKKIS